MNQSLRNTLSRTLSVARTAAVYAGILSDSAIAVAFPGWGQKRLAARASFQAVQKLLLAGPLSPYNAAKWNRLSQYWRPWNLNENAVPSIDLEVMSARARDLYRNNKHARKIVRQILAKTIGTGMLPHPKAKKSDGTPDEKFRERAKSLWENVQGQLDYRGKPGYGGQTLSALARMQLKTCVLTGHCLTRKRPITRSEQTKQGLAIPLVIQPIDPSRLDAAMTQTEGGNRILRGIEFDAKGRRVCYWLFPYHPADPFWFGTKMEPMAVDAREIIHTYDSEDPDQVSGVSWFCAALENTKDLGDLEYNELKASAMAACVALMIKRPQGVQKMGLQTPVGDTDVDDNGNAISRMQPGMFFDVGIDGKLEGFNPLRPAEGTEVFLKHLLNTLSGAIPGVKGSSLTGDYRGSSFASERSADNEVWPEIEIVQQWWGEEFYQPIYEAVIVMGVLTGYFDGVITPEQFAARRDQLLPASWHGPVCRSINPVDDANAGGSRVKFLQSSPQREAALVGVNLADNLRNLKEFVGMVQAQKFPPAIEELIIQNALGSGLGASPPNKAKGGGGSDGEGESDTSPAGGTSGGGKKFLPGPLSGRLGGRMARRMANTLDELAEEDAEEDEQPIAQFLRNGHGHTNNQLVETAAR